MSVPDSIFEQFDLPGGSVVGCKQLSVGLINDTFVANFEGGQRVVFQRINLDVFPQVEKLMENMERVVAHHGAGERSLQLVRTLAGGSMYRALDGDCWRAFPFVEGTVNVEAPVSTEQARQAGMAFGRFSLAMVDLPGPPLHEILPDFHSTEKRLAAFVAAVESDLVGRVASVSELVDAMLARSEWASTITAGKVPVRVAHNDAKIENVLFDARSGEAVCVVDLDTTMPGSVLHDFGDLVRTAVATVGEDEADLSKVGISLPVFEALAAGFLSACGEMLSPVERRLLPLAGKVIAYEQALRFLTDFFLGDPYYRVAHPKHNLERARNQLRLAQVLDLSESLLIAGVQGR